MFPPVEHANEFGVVCWGGKLSPEILLDAYSRGIFPWPHRGLPMLWFAPPERAILFVDELHVGNRLRRALRKAAFEIRFDTCFEAVVDACAAPRFVDGVFERGTWITKPLKRAFVGLHEMGFARSVEAWQDGELVGGLYGVSIGSYFAGESMFHTRDNASKACVVALLERMSEAGATWLDCETLTPHFERLGAREVRRAEFMAMLPSALQGPDLDWGC